MTAKPNAIVAVGKVKFGNGLPLAVIAGPCASGKPRACLRDGGRAEGNHRQGSGSGFVYKTSFDKANRTSASSARGLGLDKALAIFADLRRELSIPFSPMYTSRTNARRSQRPSMSCKFLRSSAARPISSLRRQRPACDQCQERSVPRALGHGQCGGQDYGARAIPTCLLPSAACRLATTRSFRICVHCRSWQKSARR